MKTEYTFEFIEKYVTAEDPRVKMRQRVEIAIAAAFVDAALAAGYTIVGTDIGDGELVEDRPKIQTLEGVLAIMFQGDVDHLELRKNGKVSFVYLVYGNDGWDVISDYTTDLDPLMTGDVLELQERFGG